MQLGNKNIIAASYTVFDDIKQPLAEGTLSYFVRGQEIGDSSRVIVLEDIPTALIYILGDKNKRKSEELYKASARDVMFSLDSELYHVPDHVKFTHIPLPEEPARFDLSLTIETFDNWRLYLIDGSNSSRLIYYRFDWKEPQEAEIPLGLVDAMLAQLSESIEQLIHKTSQSATEK